MRRQRSQIPSVPPHQGRTFSIRAQARFWPRRHGLRCSSTQYPRRVSIGTRDKLASSWMVVPGRRPRAHEHRGLPCLAAATKDRRTRGPAKPCWGLGIPRWRHPPSGRRAMLPMTAGCGSAWPSPPDRTKPRPRVVLRCKGCSVDAGSAHRQGGWHVFVAQGQAANVTHVRGQRWGRGWRPCVLDSIPRPDLFRGTARRPL